MGRAIYGERAAQESVRLNGSQDCNTAWLEDCMGSPKAAVLPEPVEARPMTSLPAMIGGMQACCTDVGLAIPNVLHTLQSQSVSPSVLKEGAVVEGSPEDRSSAALTVGSAFGAS